MTDAKRAVVVGAGIAGLAAALRLRQIGWESLVVQRSPGRRSGGYALTFSGMGYDAAQRLGILPAPARHHITPDELVYVKPGGATRFVVLLRGAGGPFVRRRRSGPLPGAPGAPETIRATASRPRNGSSASAITGTSRPMRSRA